jgi:hypothetical protein
MSASFVRGQRHYSAVPSICLKRALLVSKMTRYELECQRYPDLSMSKLEATLRRQCFDYDVLLQHHRLHKEFEHRVRTVLNDCGIETRTVNRWGVKLNRAFNLAVCDFRVELVCWHICCFCCAQVILLLRKIWGWSLVNLTVVYLIAVVIQCGHFKASFKSLNCVGGKILTLLLSSQVT